MPDLGLPEDLPAQAVIEALCLAPHPEGGWYRETFRDDPAGGGGSVTSILFLLRAGERSRWHRIDATELWLWHAGAPLALRIGAATVRLGRRLAAGEQLQAAVPAHEWQAALSLGAWSLAGCVVAPAFAFAGFELRADVDPNGPPPT